MNYTPLLLLALGMLGVLLHNLVELNKLNKASPATFSMKQYFKLERFSIIISVLVVVGSVIITQEIKQLEMVGKMLGLAFVAIGYMGQSLLIFVMGKTNRIVNSENGQAPPQKTEENP